MSDYVDAAFTRKRLQDGTAKVINVLAREKYAQQHLPSSINVPEDAPDFAEQVQRQVPDKSTPIIVHCSSMECQASTKAARRLESLGYKEIHDFKAGLQAWDEAGHPFETGLATATQPTGHQGAERPPRPGREESSRREETRTAETRVQ